MVHFKPFIVLKFIKKKQKNIMMQFIYILLHFSLTKQKEVLGPIRVFIYQLFDDPEPWPVKL